MKTNAVNHVNRFFTWTNVADAVNNIYEKVAAASQKQKAGRIILLPDFSLKQVENMLHNSLFPRLNAQ